jgi:SAM-dependent methyltransferase
MAQERSGPRHFFRLKLMDMLIGRFPNGGKALDAGCGDGSLSIRLAGNGWTVYGVDFDEAWCETARKQTASLPFKERVNIVCSPLERIDFQPGFFDLIVCGEVLEHLHNDTEVLKKFNYVLRDGGVLVLSVPLASKGFDFYDELVGHVRLYTFDELSGKLAAAGFSVRAALSWGYPFAKLYHRFVFLRWAKKVRPEEETRSPRCCMTHIGKNPLLSVLLGIFFFADVICTRPRHGIGVVLKAVKTAG